MSLAAIMTTVPPILHRNVFGEQLLSKFFFKLRYIRMIRIKGKMSDPQTSDSTKVGLTNVGLVHTSDWDTHRTSTNVGLVQTSDQYKRRSSTNVGLVQTSDWFKRRTSTKVGLVQTSDQYKRRTSTNNGLVQTSDWYKRRTSTNVRRVQCAFIKKMSDFGWV